MRRNAWVLLLFILLIGTALRLTDLSAESLWYDEAGSIHIARQPVLSIISGEVHDAGNPPFYYVLLNLWVNFTGSDSESSVRSLSAIFGILGILAAFLIASRWFDTRTGLVTALILALSPTHIYLSQEARSYSMVILLTILSFYFLKQSKVSPTRWNYLGYILSTLVLLYSHYYGFFLLAAQFIYLNLFSREPWRNRIKGQWTFLLLAVLYLPWVPVLLDQMSNSIGRSTESWHLHTLALPHYLTVGRTLVWRDSGTLTFAAIEMIVLLVIAIPLWKGTKSALKSSNLTVTWLYGTFLIVLLVSLLFTPLLNGRYLSVLLPAFVMVLSLGLIDIYERKRIVFLVEIFALGLLFFLSLIRMYTLPQKNDWSSACSYYAKHHKANEASLIMPGYCVILPQYYLKSSLEQYPLLTPPIDQHLRMHPDSSIIDQKVSALPGIWLFIRSSLSDGRYKNIQNTLESLFTNQETHSFTGLELIHFWK